MIELYWHKECESCTQIEEKLKEMARRKDDPIFRMRGKLKDKKGGTALFMEDKQTEIEKEHRA